MLENRTLYHGDCLDVMGGFSDKCFDLIYLDPPFATGRDFGAFSDKWTEDDALLFDLKSSHPVVYNLCRVAKHTHSDGMYSYLIMMGKRLIEMHRILKPTGTLWLHCDPTASHYLKAMMDGIFGQPNFRNEIVWHYGKWTNASGAFQKNHDILLAYSKSETNTFNKLRREDTPKHIARGYTTNVIKGVTQLLVYDRVKAKEKITEGKYDKVVYRDGEDQQKVALPDVWQMPILNSQSKERIGYPTQKPETLLERIIKASSNVGDVVFDPFCGCATTLVAAEGLGRNWVGCDIGEEAMRVSVERFSGLGIDITVKKDCHLLK